MKNILVATACIVLLLAVSAYGQGASCTCGDGYKCCIDQLNGAMCYRSNEHSCISNRLCQAGNQLCGDRCYDPHQHQCVDNNHLCQASEGVCRDNEGKPQCYNKNEHQCVNGNRLCSISEASCAEQCFSPETHTCFNGHLCASSEGICIVNGEALCYNKNEYQCFDNKILCGASEKECNGQCYSPETHKCINRNLCPVDSENCGVSPGEAVSCFGVSKSSANVCSSRGVCVAQDVCRCNQGYIGHDCSTHEAGEGPIKCHGTSKDSPTVCSSHGRCIANDTCLCNVGYSGNRCQTTECPSGHSGENCERYQCFGIDKNAENVCSGHGTCTRSNMCTCDEGYYGHRCEQRYTDQNKKPCDFLIGQNEKGEFEDYANAFGRTPMGGSFYSNIFEPALGPVMISYLDHMNSRYPGAKMIFGLDAKGMYHILYGGYEKSKRTVQMFKDILDGNHGVDNNIRYFANTLKSYSNLTFWMRIDYEVSGNLHANTNENDWDVSTQDPQWYKKAFCKVVRMFRELGANNVEFVYHPNRGDHLSLYPDSSCVDWIAFSVFNHDVVQPLFNGETYFWNNQSGEIDANLKRGFEWAVTTGKKIMIAESAVQRPNSRDLTMMRTYFDRLLNIIDTYNVDAWAYINSDWIALGWPAEWDDSRIETKPQEFQQWWRRTVVNNPRFIHYDTQRQQQ